MVKLTFKFDKAEVAKAGLTEDKLLKDVRVFARKHDIEETSFGVFEKDGKDAVALLTMIGIDTFRKDLAYMKYIRTLELDDDGDVEDCKGSIQEWLAEEGKI